MAREKRTLHTAAAGGAKERHRKAQKSQYDPKAPVPEGFVAKPAVPKIKHHSYFEFVENKEKKKKLEFQVTTQKTPPPGFEFIPIGNPELTTACKELSRDKDAMIFIVSNAKDGETNHLAHQMHRLGHHFREIIVEEAQADLQDVPRVASTVAAGMPEPIPESQAKYNEQVNAAIRDLFPRIPNTDRQMIIEHAFQKHVNPPRGEKPVGLSADITLARRVQLAVLAHIRHSHTRYDELLRETTWQNARKVVESLCLDMLVKWRGDEETGRDQLDEILREVVVISDSEDDDAEDGESEGEDENGDRSAMDLDKPRRQHLPAAQPVQVPQMVSRRSKTPASALGQKGPARQTLPRDGATLPKNPRMAGKRGFKRYQAWQRAINRNHHQDEFDGFRPLDPGHYPEHADPGHMPPHPLGTSQEVRISEASQSRHHELPQPYFPQPPPAYSRPSRSLPLHPNLVPLGQPVHEQPQRMPSPRPRNSPAAHGLQDMLVRSIEPTSPDIMQPSFVRALPPRRHDPIDPIPVNANMHRRLTVDSSARAETSAQDGSYFIRRVVSDGRPPEGDAQARFVEVPDLTFQNRNHHGMAPRYGGDTSHTSLPHPSRPHAPEFGPPRRIASNVPASGTRQNPIFMEDRGGFFERVPPASVPNFETHRPPRVGPLQHQASNDLVASDHRRFIPREEGPWALRRHHGGHFEAMPVQGPPHLVPHAMDQAQIRPGTFAPLAGQQVCVRRAVVETPFQHNGQIGRPPREDLRFHTYHDTTRQVPPQPNHPDHIIVLD